jgi:hypothetical protein
VPLSYEIARSVVDERGLLAVHINGLNHVSTQQPSPHGYNPLNCLGIYHSPGGKYFLAQKVDDAGNWELYEDFTARCRQDARAESEPGDQGQR